MSSSARLGGREPPKRENGGSDAFLRKREAPLAQIQGLQSAVFHIDQALALIGEAERAGNQAPTRAAQFIMAAKGMDQSYKAPLPTDRLQREGLPEVDGG